MCPNSPLQDDELFRRVWRVVVSAREHIRRLQEGKRYLGSHFNFPVLRQFDSGVPRIQFQSSDEAPPDYSGPFGLAATKWTAVGYDELDGFEDLLVYILGHDVMRQRVPLVPIDPESEEAQRFARISVALVALDPFDHAWHVAGEDFTEEDFRQVWQPVEARLLTERLPVEIWVPIALTNFESEGLDLTPAVRLEPIPEDLQLARVPRQVHGAAVSDSVVGGATHAVVLAGYTVPGGKDYQRYSHKPSFYPVDEVDLLFEALRLAADIDTGYAQVFLRPVGWVIGYTAHLADVDRGAFFRRYPAHFDDWGWLRQPPTVSGEQVDAWRRLLAGLHASPKPLRLGSRRLSMAMLRDDEADAVVDVCIGLESALGDASPTEMTHKLALRVAAALCAAEGGDAAEAARVFTQVKRLYSWRSKIVHGVGDANKARTKLEETANETAGRTVATTLLRRGLVALLQHEPPLHGDLIDQRLIMPSLGSRGAEP